MMNTMMVPMMDAPTRGQKPTYSKSLSCMKLSLGINAGIGRDASNEMLDDCDEAHLDGLSREGAQNLLHENDATQSAQCGAPKTDDLCIKIIGVSRCTEGVLVKLRTICAKNYFCTFIVVRERDNWAVRGTFIFELALIEQHR
jgi:hypothetical protein